MTYFSLISVLLVFSLIADFRPDNRKLMVYMSFLLILLISSIRFEMGYDYNRYMDRVLYIFDFSNRIKLEYLSYLSLVLGKLIHSQVYFALNSSIQILLLYFFLKDSSEDSLFSLFIFVLFPMFMLNSWSVVRNFSAIITTVYSTKFIFNRELKLYLIFVGIASLFHISAISALPLYFLYEKKIKIKNIVIFSSISYLVVNLVHKLRYLLPTRIGNYFIVSNHEAGSKTIFVLLFILITFSLFFHYLKISRFEDKEILFYYHSLLIGIVIYIVMYKFSTISYRLTLYYYIYIIVLIPNGIKMILRRILSEEQMKKTFLIIKYSIIFLFIPMFVYMLIVGGKYYYPYKSIFTL